MALWMFAQVNPSLPMLGNVFISEVARPLFEVARDEPFSWLGSLTVALNLLMLGMLLLTLLRQRRHAVSALLLVLSLVALTKFVAAAVLLKSWALLLWLNSEAMLGIFAGTLLLVAANWLPRTRLVWVAAFHITGLSGAGALGAGQRVALCRHAPLPVALRPSAQLQRSVANYRAGVPIPVARLPVAREEAITCGCIIIIWTV